MSQDLKVPLSSLKIRREDKGTKAPKRSKQWLWGIGGIALIVIIVLMTDLFSPVPEVNTATVTQVYPSLGSSVLNASGYVVAQRKAAVASKATGRLVALNVVEGDVVRNNEILARLESSDVEAAVMQARATVEQWKATLLQAQAELDDAKAHFTRNKALRETGSISASEFDIVEARYKRAQAAVRATEATVKASEAALRAVEVQLENTYIRAPFDGTVLTKNADVGEVVAPFGAAGNAKAAVVTMADMTSLQVEADVSESQIEKVKERQPCEITLDAFPEKRYRGEVAKIVPTADRTKATVMTKIRFLDLDERVLPEMSAKVAFLSEPLSEASFNEPPKTVVPPSAVLKKNGADVVFVVSENSLVERKVSLGEMSGSMRVVISGLIPGEKVVLSPQETMTDGTTVKIKEQ